MKRSSFLKTLAVGLAIPITSLNLKDKQKSVGDYGSSFSFNANYPYEIEIYNSKLKAGQLIQFPDEWIGYVIHTSEENGRKTAKVKSFNNQRFNPKQLLKYDVFNNALTV